MTRTVVLLALWAPLAACTQATAVRTAADLLTPPERRCEEARGIWDALPPAERTDLNAAYVAVACAG